MACSKRSRTALERYAKSLQQANSGQEIPMPFPMYTVPVKDVLEMQQMRPHEQLLQDDLLVEFDSSMGKAALISHQWVSPWNPDPDLRQFKHLQSVLKEIVTSAKRVDPHVMTELLAPLGWVKGIPIEEFRSRPLFIWYDYFSCPQVDHLKWSTVDLHKPIEQALESIPAYVARCEFFFVLAPPVETQDEAELLGLSTWASRGWCRFEKALKELQPDKKYIVINGENSYGTIESAILSIQVGGPPGEGIFGFSEDRTKLGKVLVLFLRRLLLHCLEEEDFTTYRFYLNLQSVYLRGFQVSNYTDLFHPVPASQDHAKRDLESSDSLAAKFFFQNGFQSINEIDSAGWSPLCYAALRGDPDVVRSLLEDKADPSTQTRKDQPTFGVQKGMSALGIAVFFSHNQAARVLIEAKASLSRSILPPLHAAAMAGNVEGIRMICQVGEHPWKHTVYGVTALQFAATTSSIKAIRELLVQSNYTMDLSGALMVGMVYNRGTVELVDELVKAKADVNDAGKFLPALWSFLNFRYMCGRRTPAARLGHLSFGATPLMFAIAGGQYEGAAALIVARANLGALNYRKQTALDVAREFGAPQFLVDALENNPTVCRRMVNSALTNRYLVHEKF